jgi:TDG/mug DNA glycosylase family protein
MKQESKIELKPFVPVPAQLRAARSKTVPDVLAPGLQVLFCGINPGLYTAAVGHHFARPGNRFWKALHGAGFTPRVLSPFEDASLPRYGCGITNLVRRATAAAAELSEQELVRGKEALVRKVRRYKPRVLAVLGVGAFRLAFGRPEVSIGPQPDRIGTTRLWVLPNPSGLNANYQLNALIGLLKEVRDAVRSPV